MLSLRASARAEARREAASEWSRSRNGEESPAGHHVRRRRHAGVAGIARIHAETVHSADWHGFDFPADNQAPRRADVRRAGRRHQPRLPLSGARAARGDRRQGADCHRAGAPRFRRGGGDRRRDRRGARSADRRRRLRRRPCRARPEGLPRRLRHRRRSRRRRGRDRHARRDADRAGDRLRLHPSRRFARRSERAPGRRLRREAQPRSRQALHGGRLSVELGQLLLPRRRDAIGVAGLRTGNGRSDRGGARRGARGSRFSHPRQGSVRALAEEVDRLCGDGAHPPRRGGAGRRRLVGRRQLGRGVEAQPPRRQRQRHPRQRRRLRVQERPYPFGRPADGGGRRRRRHGGVDPGRGAGA